MSKVYDCFMFFNELDLLEIRLETLDPYVDYFVISECDSTFSGIDKPYVFEKNKDKFAKFADKIIHVKNHNSKECVNLSNTYDGKKYDIYNNHIKDNWNIISVFDDRNQVVDMWRNGLRLQCFQVADGNF